MTPRHYNELMRQAEVLERDKEMLRFNKLFEEYQKENPTKKITEEERIAMAWLYNALVTDKEKYINNCIL